MKSEITKLINDSKKNIERLEDKRQTNLGNSINFIENEIMIQRLDAEIRAYETVLNLFK